MENNFLCVSDDCTRFVKEAPDNWREKTFQDYVWSLPAPMIAARCYNPYADISTIISDKLYVRLSHHIYV